MNGEYVRWQNSLKGCKANPEFLSLGFELDVNIWVLIWVYLVIKAFELGYYETDRC